MQDKKLVIVGIDPGTTTGYAVLDLDGKVLSIKSSKNLGLNELIKDVLNLGKVVSVGTDKAKVPNLVYLFSVKTGAKMLHPKEDLKVKEKKKLTYNFETKNDHQDDALASSLFAFNRIKNVIDRVDSYVDEKKKYRIRERIIDIVLTKELSIREAVGLIEDKGKEETRIIKKVVEKKELNQKDFVRLYRITKRYEKEIYLLKKQNFNLKNSIRNVEKKYNSLNYRINKSKYDEKVEKNIKFKEKNIKFLDNEVHSKDRKIKDLLFDIRKFNDVLSRWNDIFILKKLENLGSSEFDKKKSFLNIVKNDVLLVNNLDIISKEVVEFLKGKVRAIVTKVPNNKVKEKYDFVFIDYNKLVIEENEFFAITSKKNLDDALKDKDTLNSLVENYKRQRKIKVNP
jgi:uncharacterized protein